MKLNIFKRKSPKRLLMSPKDYLRRNIMIIYAIVVAIISLTSFLNDLVASNYYLSLMFTHILALIVGIYLVDYKHLKLWLRKRWIEAETRSKIRKEIELKLKKEYGQE